MFRSLSSRRDYLKTIGGAGAAAAAALAILKSTSSSTNRYSANDTIAVACLGTGNRCQMLMKSLAQVPGVRIGAVCDVYDPRLDEAKKLADPKAIATKQYRELLDRRDIDAVLIASPDHWHVPMAIDACNAGKDVYVEKPLTHHPAEGAAIVDAQNRNKSIVQVGMQQRSMPHIQKARELAQGGRIGKIAKINISWNRWVLTRFKPSASHVDPRQVAWKDFLGSAPEQPFDEIRFRDWRCFWDFGGGMLTDLMVHWIDLAHWFLDVDHPLRATTIGSHFIMPQGERETPDAIQCILEYPNNVQVHFEANLANSNSGAMITFMGTEGTLYIDRGRYEFTPEHRRGKPESWILGTKPAKKGQDSYDAPNGEFLHLANWVECVRSRRPPNAPTESGVSAAAASHLGNRAYRSGATAVWTT
jgi:predicted dehydrogenase